MTRGFPHGVEFVWQRLCKRVARVWRSGVFDGERPRRRGGSMARAGIDLFIEDGAYTTVASAVSILVILTIVFSSATAIWSMSRAGDVQVAADATALAGANVVAGYATTATTVDASILSLGLAGFCVTGVGLVALLIPSAQAAAEKTVDCGVRILETRNKFAKSASTGLKKLERALPYLVAASSVRTCAAQSTDDISYAGAAFAVPRESASEFPAIDGEGVDTDKISRSADELSEAAKELAQASEKTTAACKDAWIADCGREGRNMQERASKLSGISGTQNPDYASSITWEPNVALKRTRAYYTWRLEHNAPEGSGTEVAVDAAARRAFYEYAIKKFEHAKVEERDGTCMSNVELLPKNAAEVRQSELYTEAVWPTSLEDGKRVLHYGTDCPGAKGASGGAASLASLDAGEVSECPVCRFGVGDVGKAPAASTSIDNGYEYHLREYTEALDRYVECRNRELELEQKARGQAKDAATAFKDAISKLGGARPKIAPPGRFGCVAAVVSGGVSSPSASSDFSQAVRLPGRGAVSAAALAPDAATAENNVLSRFFSSLAERSGGGGVPGLVNDVMALWGKLLVGYGDMGKSLKKTMDGLLDGLTNFGLGPIATWLSDSLDSCVSALGFEAVDLSLKKPVLTDSSNVLAHADVESLTKVQDALRSIPLGTRDPATIMRALEYDVKEYIDAAEFTIAEIPIPGGGTIPLTVKVRDLAELAGGGSK